MRMPVKMLIIIVIIIISLYIWVLVNAVFVSVSRRSSSGNNCVIRYENGLLRCLLLLLLLSSYLYIYGCWWMQYLCHPLEVL